MKLICLTKPISKVIISTVYKYIALMNQLYQTQHQSYYQIYSKQQKMSKFRAYSPPVPMFPHLMDHFIQRPPRPSFDDQTTSFQKQSVRTTIRPEQKQISIGQQLDMLINRPKPTIFNQTKRLDLAYHKITYSRSRSKSKDGKEKLLQEISEKLNTVTPVNKAAYGKEKQKQKVGVSLKTKPSFKRGEMNPGAKMAFQRQTSLRVAESVPIKVEKAEVKSEDIIAPTINNSQQAQKQKEDNKKICVVKIDKELGVKKQQVITSRINIISNFVPLYVEFFSIHQNIEIQKEESREHKELQIQNQKGSIQYQQCKQKENNYITVLNNQLQTIDTQMQIVQQTVLQQNSQYIVVPNKQASLSPESQTQKQTHQQQQFVEVDFYSQIKILDHQIPLSVECKQQLPVLQKDLQQQITIKSEQKENSQITSKNEDYSEVKLDNKLQQFPQVLPLESQIQFQQSTINEFKLQRSSTQKQPNQGDETCVSRQNQYQQLQKFIKQNQQKFNNNLLQVNMRREMQKQLELFWSQDTPEQSLSKSDTKSVQIPITQQEIEEDLSEKQLKIEHFQKGKRLGKGMFGEVFIVRHINTGFMCALKILKKDFIRTQKMTEQLFQQLKIHSSLNHPNVVQIYGYFADQENIYVLQQLCTGGQLFDLVVKRRRISQKRTAYYIKQLAQGLRYLQTMNIVHRDIKPQNILIQEGVIKICDFGWAMFSIENLFVQKCGTPLYMSPEVVKGETYSDKVDVWGLGLITYELIIGNIPWNIWTEQETSKIVTDDLTFPSYVPISSRAEDFIRKALTKEPEERITLLESFTHGFLIEVNPMQYQNQTFQSYGEATP